MTKNIINCFIASPNDTEQERQICKNVIEELNKSIGEKFQFVLQTRMWENNTRPTVASYPQEAVSNQLGEDYQIFIGIMYKKFGTETKNAGSGTEEEFNNAYEKHLRKEPIEIMFYFNEEPTQINDIDPIELSKVSLFKKKISELGAYYWTYKGFTDFEKQLRSHLSDLLLEKYSQINTNEQRNTKQNELITKYKLDLDLALKAYNSQPIIWVDPILSNTREISQNADENYSKRIDVNDIINNPRDLCISAPPQFGLTSLARFLILKSCENGSNWLYIDSTKFKSHNIHNGVKREAESLGLTIENINVIILDSWLYHESDNHKKLRNLCDSYSDKKIILLQTIFDSKFLEEDPEVKIEREFENLFLLALPRNQIRKVVSEYNKQKEIGIEDIVLNKVVSDMEVLNIHRTPLNCLTLLKVAEKYFDESPINRTDMVEKVLFVLFNGEGVPTYKTKPDLKDCEYVLGRFCEILIKNENYVFSKEKLITELKSFCNEKLIDLEVEIVFEILFANNIIIKTGNDFIFRSSFWVYYFVAKRMHNDPSFEQYIYDTKKYIVAPEIIEFYTGIDRSKTSALQILKKDIAATREIVKSKVRLPDNMNFFDLIKWEPSQDEIQLFQEKLSEDVIKSGLPDSIKDQHADRSYNQIRPYDQSIQTFFSQYSLHNLMQNIRASSRALRNSDYIQPDLKREILNEILNSWEQISKVLLTLTPILATKGEADFEGSAFQLIGEWGNTFEEKTKRIILVNFANVVGFFKDDIYSSKLAPLFYEKLELEEDKNIKHQIALLIIYCRPRNWKKQIENYITSIHKNSFYLYDTFNTLQAKRKYDYLNDEDRNDITYLLKMCFAKHEFGSKKPGIHEISKVRLTKDKNEKND